jgi:hypothetical protein
MHERQKMNRSNLKDYYESFFEDILQRISMRRPGLVDSAIVRPQHWLMFRSGISGFKYVWSFRTGHNFSVELCIATGSRKRNQFYFDRLHCDQDELAVRLGPQLSWESLNKKGVCYLRLESDSDSTATGKELEALKEWGVVKMLAFVAVLQPKLQELTQDLDISRL